MQKKIIKIVVGFAFFFLMTTLGASAQEMYDMPYKQGGGDFVELKDGTMLRGKIGKTAAMVSYWSSGGHVMLDGEKYKFKDMQAFQKDSIYYTNTGNNTFAFLHMHGKINEYMLRRVSAGGYTEYVYYIQKGDKGPLVKETDKSLREMISDSEPALKVLDDYKALSSKEKRKSLISPSSKAMEVYNNQ